MEAVTEIWKEMLFVVEMGGFSLHAQRCEIEEGMSQLERAYIEIANESDVDFGPLIETDVTVSVLVDGFEVRRFVRRLASATFLAEHEGKLHYGVELRPKLWFAGHSMNTRKFRDMTTEAIVDKVLAEEGVDHKWETLRSSNSRPFTVQYRETTLAFVERLLEFEGFYYYFDEDGTMIIGDTSSAVLGVEGLPVYSLLETTMMNHEMGLLEIQRGAKISPGHATVNDHNFKTPRTSLLQTAQASIDHDLEIYDYPTGYRDPGTGGMLARLRLESLTAEKRYVEGVTNVPQFTPARIFEVAHMEAVNFSGSYLLVRVRHVYEAASPGSGDRKARTESSYKNYFFATPSGVPWRPPMKTPHPVIHGNHTATVVGPPGEEIHTDVYGRAKVKFHWDREAKGTDEDSRWMRVLQETSSSMVLSRVGWEIVTTYIDGDPDRPVGVARNINGKMRPTYGQPSRKNIMTIKTETYPGKQGFNELRMDDSAGAMRMDWHAQRDLLNSVENNRTETISNNHLHLVKKGLDRVVVKNQTVVVGGTETKDVQTSYFETVKADRVESIGGSEHVKVKVSASNNVIKNEKETVGAVRFSLVGVGAVSLPSPKTIAGILVPHTLGVPHDDMLSESGAKLGAGAGDGHVAANTEKGGAAGPLGPYSGEGQFGGFGQGSNVLTGFSNPSGAPSSAGGPSGAPGGGAPAGGPSGAPAGGAPAAGNASDGGGISGLISDLTGGQGFANTIGSVVGNVTGNQTLGSSVSSFASALQGGQSLQGALGQGIQNSLGSVVGSATGSPALGSSVSSFASALQGGQGLQGALGQGIQGGLGSLAGQVGGPVGSALGGMLGQGGALSGLGSAIASGNLSNVTGALTKGYTQTFEAFKGQFTAAGLKSMGADLVNSMFKGSINKETRKKLTRIIGGAEIVGAGGAIMQGSNYVFTEVVGGLKMSLAAEGSVMQSAAKFLVHTVGGMIIRKSKEDMSMSAKKTTIRAGLAKIHSDEKVELRGKVIEIEGQEKVTLKSGDLVIELAPGTTTIKGAVKVKSGQDIKVSGSPNKLTG